jgi:hypothetical protein
MARFALRHWTAIVVLVVVAAWAVFYLPTTPSYTVFELEQAISARNGNAAASYVDFQKVVRNAGYEMVHDENGANSGASAMIGQLFGKGAVDLFSGPMAALAQQWAVQKVDDGAKEVQMPPAAVAAAIVLMHRSGDIAYTRWTDNKGQVWEVRMAREDGVWRIAEVKNVKQLLEKLQRHEEKELNAPAP